MCLSTVYMNSGNERKEIIEELEPTQSKLSGDSDGVSEG